MSANCGSGVRQGKHVAANGQVVLFGSPTAKVLPRQLLEWGASRVVLATNTSLAGTLARRVRTMLEPYCVDFVTGIGAHAPREDVVRLTNSLRHNRADAVVAVGGGSVCSALKAARLCLANGVSAVDDVDKLFNATAVEPPQLRSLVIPTTLSAGEFTPFAGVTDRRVPRKQALYHPRLAPDVVVLDPGMSADTPRNLWLGTGIRAVDHAVETWCSLNGTPFSDALALHALRLLDPALRRCAQSGEDVGARQDCQIGAWLSVQGIAGGVDQGASHGIGHALGGTAGVAHGDTSCIMLPHVLRFNAAVNSARQAELARGCWQSDNALSDLVGELVASLGLVHSLRQTGIAREVLPIVAEEAARATWVKTNPRPLRNAAEVLGLLYAGW